MTIAAAELAAEHRALAGKLRRAERRRTWKAFALVVPLLAFLLLVFVIPLGGVLYYSIANPEVVTILPRAACPRWRCV